MLQECSFQMYQTAVGQMKFLRNLISTKTFLLKYMNHPRLQDISQKKWLQKQDFLLKHVLLVVLEIMPPPLLVQVLLKTVVHLLLLVQAVLYLHIQATFLLTLWDECIHSVVQFQVHGISWELHRQLGIPSNGSATTSVRTILPKPKNRAAIHMI